MDTQEPSTHAKAGYHCGVYTNKYVTSRSFSTYFGLTQRVRESDRRKYGITNAQIEYAGRVVEYAPDDVIDLVKQAWKESDGNKPLVASAVLASLPDWKHHVPKSVLATRPK